MTKILCSQPVTEKLQKVLAAAGYGSRRAMQLWISAGRVTVNGLVATLGDRVDADARIVVDGTPIPSRKAPVTRRVLLYHKPLGQVCTRNDPQGRPVVFDYLPAIQSGRWIMVGRLDINTAGLLLFTNDGAFANQLMHPSFHVEREYAVRVFGTVMPSVLEQLKSGVVIDGQKSAFEKIFDKGQQGINHWYHVVVREGRNRMVRKMWESQGLQVSRLIRVRYAKVKLPKELKPKEWIELANPYSIV